MNKKLVIDSEGTFGCWFFLFSGIAVSEAGRFAWKDMDCEGHLIFGVVTFWNLYCETAPSPKALGVSLLKIWERTLLETGSPDRGLGTSDPVRTFQHWGLDLVTAHPVWTTIVSFVPFQHSVSKIKRKLSYNLSEPQVSGLHLSFQCSVFLSVGSYSARSSLCLYWLYLLLLLSSFYVCFFH